MENIKRGLFKQLLELTKLQKKALEEENLELFEELIDKRQSIIEQVDALHQQHPELKAHKENDILKEIIDLDKKNNELFEQQFEEVKQKLKEVRQNKKRENLYGNPYDVTIEEGIFFDKR